MGFAAAPGGLQQSWDFQRTLQLWGFWVEGNQTRMARWWGMGGGGDSMQPQKWGVLMLLCTAACPNTQPGRASVSLAAGTASCKAIRLFAGTEQAVPVHWQLSRRPSAGFL